MDGRLSTTPSQDLEDLREAEETEVEVVAMARVEVVAMARVARSPDPCPAHFPPLRLSTTTSQDPAEAVGEGLEDLEAVDPAEEAVDPAEVVGAVEAAARTARSPDRRCLAHLPSLSPDEDDEP